MGRGPTGFADVARSELRRLYSLARRLTDDDPEDLVQECLLRAFKSYDSLNDSAATGGWLRTILVNVFRDRLRKQGREVDTVAHTDDDFSLYRTIADADPFPYSDSLHLDFLDCFEEADVRAVLMRLPVLYRAPLVLRYMEGLATKEIAQLLDVPLGTALARLHRGRKRFEKELWAYASERALLAEREVAR